MFAPRQVYKKRLRELVTTSSSFLLFIDSCIQRWLVSTRNNDDTAAAAGASVMVDCSMPYEASSPISLVALLTPVLFSASHMLR